MQKIMYIVTLGGLFSAMQTGNFLYMIMAAIFAYVLIKAAFIIDGEDEKED